MPTVEHHLAPYQNLERAVNADVEDLHRYPVEHVPQHQLLHQPLQRRQAFVKQRPQQVDVVELLEVVAQHAYHVLQLILLQHLGVAVLIEVQLACSHVLLQQRLLPVEQLGLLVCFIMAGFVNLDGELVEVGVLLPVFHFELD